MRPKGKLFALLAIFAAIGLVTATGAFTSVSAERTVSVDLAGDSSALLGINGTSPYATENSDGTVSFDMSANNGLNVNATTNFDGIMNVTNNGDNPVHVTVNVTSLDGASAGFLTIYDSETNPSTVGETPPEFTGTDVSPGEAVTLGFSFDTEGLDETDSFDVGITINATATS